MERAGTRRWHLGVACVPVTALRCQRFAWAVFVPSENENWEPKLQLDGSEEPFINFNCCPGYGLALS